MDPQWVKDAKQFAMDLTGLSQDALHIYVGLLVLLGVCALLRRPLGSWLPWVAVLVVALVGESFDLRFDLARNGHWRWQESVHDLLNTMFWPTLLTVLAKLRVVRTA